MFARVSSVLLFALAASASVLPRDGTSCSTGPVQCCNSVQNATTSSTDGLGGLLGLLLGPVTGLIGLNCSPLSILGVGSNSCNTQTVCCTGNTFGGLISLGCTPININL